MAPPLPFIRAVPPARQVGTALFSLKNNLSVEPAAISYALQKTRILYVPDRRIDTFGETRFNYRLISEPLDEVGTTRIRSGWVEANKPRILRPADLVGIETEGFSEQAQQFFDWMEQHGTGLKALFQYGFRFSRTEVMSEVVHDSMDNVSERVAQEALSSGDAYRAVIQGVDDAWEVSLLRFMTEMIQQSHEINIFDFKRRGLL